MNLINKIRLVPGQREAHYLRNAMGTERSVRMGLIHKPKALDRAYLYNHVRRSIR